MRHATLLLALTLGMGALGCLAPEDGHDSASANVAAKAVDWEVWEEPTLIELGEPIEAEVAYGQCEQTDSSVEQTEDGVINIEIDIDCGQAWGEVAWFVLSAETLSEATGDEVAFSFALDPEDERALRAQILDEAPDGTVTKVAVEHRLVDGESVAAPLLDGHGYQLHVARGDYGGPLWATGSLRFSVVATASSSAPQ